MTLSHLSTCLPSLLPSLSLSDCVFVRNCLLSETERKRKQRIGVLFPSLSLLAFALVLFTSSSAHRILSPRFAADFNCTCMYSLLFDRFSLLSNDIENFPARRISPIGHLRQSIFLFTQKDDSPSGRWITSTYFRAEPCACVCYADSWRISICCWWEREESAALSSYPV